ncbi:hypothetical protein ACQP10_38275 (plasmid) [Streptosporangium sandarakinum]|uniref:hypothetical protein n=1 Tax=Streptosporangium sandarakinum TaxID=1260955 RepID=UPI003D89FA28
MTTPPIKQIIPADGWRIAYTGIPLPCPIAAWALLEDGTVLALVPVQGARTLMPADQAGPIGSYLPPGYITPEEADHAARRIDTTRTTRTTMATRGRL